MNRDSARATGKFMSPHDVQKAWTFSERVWPSKKMLFYIWILFSFMLELHFW